MVAWAFDAALHDIEERNLDLLPLLQRIARRPPEKAVDVVDATTALAAAECVAAAAGRPPAPPPEALLRWLEEHPSPPEVPLMAAAVKAVDRLRRETILPPGAELDDLRVRLHGGGEGRRTSS